LLIEMKTRSGSGVGSEELEKMKGVNTPGGGI